MKRILVIAEDMDILVVLDMILKSENFCTVCTQNVQKGLSLLKYSQDVPDAKFDAVVLNAEKDCNFYLAQLVSLANPAPVVALDYDYIEKQSQDNLRNLFIVDPINKNYPKKLPEILHQQLTPK